jgi:hypothetical protein
MQAQGTIPVVRVFRPQSMTTYSRTVLARWSNFTNINADFEGRRYHAYYGTDKNLLPTDEVFGWPLERRACDIIPTDHRRA